MKTPLGAVALLVWGTHIVRAGLLRVHGANFRHLPASSVRSALKSEAVTPPPEKLRANPGQNMRHRPAYIINITQPKPQP